MTGYQSSSSLSKADLDLLLKRMSVQLWILEGCDKNKPLLLKQDECLGCFNLEFDHVIGDIPFTDDQLACVYMAGLKDELAASLRPLRPISDLLEAKYLAHEEATKVVAETQESDGLSLSTQEVHEKALEDQEARGSSQEESVDKQEDKRATSIRGGCDCKETLLLKQYGSIAEFNLEFDLVTSDLTLSEEELVCVYIAGLEHEIAAPGRLLWPRTLREAKHQARCHELVIQTQDSHHDDEGPITILARLAARALKKLQQKKNLMNIKLSYSNDVIKQILEKQNLKENLIRARKKNLLNSCEDCMKLSRSNNVSEEETTSDESHSEGSDRSQSSTDESHSQGSDRSQSSTDESQPQSSIDESHSEGSDRSPSSTDESNGQENLIRARKKNLLNCCEDCLSRLKLSRSNDVSEEETTSDESHSEGSDRSQLSTDESQSEGSDRSQSSTDKSHGEGSDRSQASIDESHGEGSDRSPSSTDESHGQGSDRSQLSTDESNGQGSDRSQSSTDESHGQGSDRSQSSTVITGPS